MSGVTTTRNEYKDLLPDVQRNRDAVSGERKIKERDDGVRYLPPLASMCISYLTDEETGQSVMKRMSSLTMEGRASYLKYLSMAYFYNATGRTVDGLKGLIFSKEPRQDIPNQIDYLKDNVDGKGTSLRAFAQSLCDEAFITPWQGILVDHPETPEGLSKLEVERGNYRPRLNQYSFESIINWHYEIVNNELKLVLLVLKECIQVRKNTFEIESKDQYRVLQLIDGVYTVSVYDDKGEIISESTPRKQGSAITEIPFFWINVGTQNKSIISDLVDANLNHYRFFADYAAKEHASAFPVFYETGVTGDSQNVVTGPGAKWENQQPDAQFGVLQTESDGGSMRTYLEDMEKRMAALGAEMLKPRINQAESAEAKSLDQVAQNSTTADVANNASEAIERALQFSLEWLGSKGEVEYRLNTDYNPEGMNPQMLTALFNAYQSGGISFETFYSNLQKGEIADPDVSAEDEQLRITIADSGV